MQKGNFKKPQKHRSFENLLKYTNIKEHSDKNHSLLHARVLTGFVLLINSIPSKQDGSLGQKKPSAASAIQQHQKPNENVKFFQS